MIKDSISHPYFQLSGAALGFLMAGIILENTYAQLFTILMIGINWILVLRLIMHNPFLDRRPKIFWAVVVVLVPAVGSMAYVMMESRKLGINPPRDRTYS